MKRIFTHFSVLTLFCLLMMNVAVAQNNITVSGQVKDEGNQPIPFASIMVKGTNRAVQTEPNGNYTISVPSNATLVFA